MKRLWIEKVNLWHFWSLAGALLIALASWYPINPTATSLHISYCLPLFDSYCNMSCIRASHLYPLEFVPWKILQNAVQTRWPYVNGNPLVKRKLEVVWFPITPTCLYLGEAPFWKVAPSSRHCPKSPPTLSVKQAPWNTFPLCWTSLH